MQTIDLWMMEQKRQARPGAPVFPPTDFERFVCSQLDQLKRRPSEDPE